MTVFEIHAGGHGRFDFALQVGGGKRAIRILGGERVKQSDEARVEAANAERKRQICADSDKLLKMATDLKDDLNKTSKDTLSIETIHKIDAIQKLTKDMKDKLRLRSN